MTVAAALPQSGLLKQKASLVPPLPERYFKVRFSTRSMEPLRK